MTPDRSTAVRQYNTHAELLARDVSVVATQRTPALDAIVVPASRPAANLRHAITLAVDIGCQLILLCSRRTRVSEVSQMLANCSPTQASVIELPRGYSHEWFDFYTSRWARRWLPKPCGARDTDLSVKRNLGLMIARMRGWERLLFLDDDITGFDAAAVRYTASMLDRYDAVGTLVTDFPDNSVVCHAHRATGGRQDVLVSGSVLAVDCTAPISFFPDIYNEDWLFFYNNVVNQSLGCSGLSASQLCYDPFADPRRAARQEFGDVLAEGLYALLHDGRYRYDTGDYWSHFLAARRTFLDAIIDRVESAEEEKRPKIRAAVETARYCLDKIRPYHCEEYIALWKDDLNRWDQRVREIPAAPTIGAALQHLGLAEAPVGATASDRPSMLDMHVSAPPARATTSDTPALSGYAVTSSALPGPDVTTDSARECAPVQELLPASPILPAARSSRASLTTASRLVSLPANFVQLCAGGIAALLRRLIAP